MADLKKWLTEACKQELKYYDVVSEWEGEVDYEKIVDFLLKKVSKRLREMLFMEGI